MRTVAALTLLVLLARPGESYSSDPVFRLVEILKHCRHSIVPYDQTDRDNVVNYCVSLVVQMEAIGVYKACGSFYSWKDDGDTPVNEDQAFSTAASLVFDNTCQGVTPPSVPETEPPPSKTCGRSNSLLRSFMRIVGGRPVTDCSVIPWQVKLNVGPYLCGGSIISDRHILTAAHCVDNLAASDVTVILAEHDLSKDDTYEEKRYIRSITMHKDYNSSVTMNDIAILTLEYPIQFNNPCVAKICRDPSFDFDGMYCTVSGWGSVLEGWFSANTLQMVKVKTHRGQNCQKQFNLQDPGYVHDVDQMVCAGYAQGGKDSCQGDSGGPLFCLDSRTNTFLQVGIVSYGYGCAREGYPGVYTSVAYFHDWIEKVMYENSY